MAKERKFWGMAAQEAGWQIDEWSASLLTIGQVKAWHKEVREQRQKK